MYELWDTESGNIIQTYEREDDALALIRSTIHAHGDSYAVGLALLEGTSHGELKTVAAGDELASRAMSEVSPFVEIP